MRRLPCVISGKRAQKRCIIRQPALRPVFVDHGGSWCWGSIAMKQIFSSNQIVGAFAKGQKEFEVCAIAEANFDEERSELVLHLDSFIQAINITSKEVQLQSDWLPKKQIVKEQVSSNEAPELARDIFHHWAKTLRQSIPPAVPA